MSTNGTPTNGKPAEAEDIVTDDGKINWAKLPKAKRGKFLTEVSTRLAGCHKKDTFEVFGTWYTLRTLDPFESDWTLQFIQGDVLYAIGKSKRAPTVAAALVAMGPDPEHMEPVEALFEMPADLAPSVRRVMATNPYFERDWRRSEILRFLCAPEGHEALIEFLYDRYLSLEEKRNNALEALSPLSKRTPSGGSEPTSSEKQAASSPTPPSGS